MALNGISTLSTKEAKQIAKLTLAQSDRDRVGNPRASYDIDRLPTKYHNDDLIDNPNAGGLIGGRPWVEFEAGIYQYHISGDWNSVVSNITGATPTGSVVATNFQIPSQSTNRSELFRGYFKPDYTGTWTFSMTSDDASALWIGPNAVNGYTIGNALITATFNTGTVTGTISLVAGSYYPMMVMYGNGGGPGSLSLSYSHTGQSSTTDYTGKLFYNPVTNGI